MSARPVSDAVVKELLPSSETILETPDVDARPWRQFAGNEGVADKVLWSDPLTASYAGVMAIAPGRGVRAHVHRRAVHHLCVLRGTCRIGEGLLSTGSYVFVPAGVEHRIDEGGPDGCTLFFLYLSADARGELP